MKKIITVCMLAMAVLFGGMSADAKTTKKSSTKKSSSAPAGITARFVDGYPDITGHTSKMVDQGITLKVIFKNNGDAAVNLSDKRHSENLAFECEYLGEGLVELVAVDGSTGMYIFIEDNGKNLYPVDDYGDVIYSNPPLKLVK